MCNHFFFIQNIYILIHNDKRTLRQTMSGNYNEVAKRGIPQNMTYLTGSRYMKIQYIDDFMTFNTFKLTCRNICIPKGVSWRKHMIFLPYKLPGIQIAIPRIDQRIKGVSWHLLLMIAERVWIKKIPWDSIRHATPRLTNKPSED